MTSSEHKPHKVEGGRPRGATSLDATASNQHSRLAFWFWMTIFVVFTFLELLRGF